MKYILVIEDTPDGLRCTGTSKPNDVTDSLEKSLAAMTVSNWAAYLSRLGQKGLIYIEKE